MTRKQTTSLTFISLRYYGYVWYMLIYQHVLILGHVLPFQNLLCSTQRQNELWVLIMGVYLACNPHNPAHRGHSLAKIPSCIQFPNADLLLLMSIITEPYVITIYFGLRSSHATHTPQWRIIGYVSWHSWGFLYQRKCNVLFKANFD